MPSPATCAAATILTIAAGVSGMQCWRAIAAFDASKVGDDAISRLRSKFAALRAELPPLTPVKVVTDELEPTAADLALLDAFSAALLRQLNDDTAAPTPGIDGTYLQQVADGFRRLHSPAENRDPEAVRKNLANWWAGLTGNMQELTTQFGLLPYVLPARAATEWVVGDFSPTFDYTALAARRRLRVVKDFGGGAVLFRADP